MRADRIEWLTWIGAKGKKVHTHAFLVVDGERRPNSLCSNRPGRGAKAVEGTPAEDRCVTCDEALRDLGRKQARRRAASKDEYEPRHRFEDHDR